MNTSLLSISLAAGVAQAAVAQIVVDPASSYTAGSQPSGVAFVDADNDGDLDLATTVDGPDRIQILLNGGTGTYTLGASVFLGASSSPQDILSADFNGDGIGDLAVALRDPVGSVNIYAGNGAGGFSLMSSATVGDRPRGLSAGDIDGDGDMDLAVANRDDNSAHVLRNNGGAMTPIFISTGQEPRKTVLADFDGDGDLDLGVTNHDDRTIGVYTNTGGAFSLTATLFVNPITRPEGLDAGDIDNDGDMDLVAGVSDDVLNGAQVFINNGGSFSAGPVYASGGQNTGHVMLADLDCDGLLDVVATNNDSANVSILPGQGGSFGAAMITAVGVSPDEIAIADIDGDGDLDVASANRDSNSLSVIRNQSDCGTPANPDVNGDGVVDFSDLISVLSAWGACSGCPQDLDGDGMVGFTDVTTVLAAWG